MDTVNMVAKMPHSKLFSFQAT